MLCLMTVGRRRGCGAGRGPVHRMNKTDKTQIEKLKNLAPQIHIECLGVFVAN